MKNEPILDDSIIGIILSKKKRIGIIEVQLKLNPNYLLNKGSYISMFISSLGVLYDIVEP
jgi:hypothetical protein